MGEVWACGGGWRGLGEAHHILLWVGVAGLVSELVRQPGAMGWCCADVGGAAEVASLTAGDVCLCTGAVGWRGGVWRMPQQGWRTASIMSCVLLRSPPPALSGRPHRFVLCVLRRLRIVLVSPGPPLWLSVFTSFFMCRCCSSDADPPRGVPPPVPAPTPKPTPQKAWP